MHIKPVVDLPVGADIVGVDLTQLKAEEFEGIYAAWLKHAVLRFRDQNLSDDQLKEFSMRFGPLEYAPRGVISKADLAKVPNPYVTVISNVVENGRPIGGLSNAETSWHTDMSYIQSPPTASILYAVEVPSSGGDTSFCCMRSPISDMPADLKNRLRSTTIKHDAAHDSIGKMRRGHKPFASPKDAPGAVHPAIRIHPETMEEVLFLGRRQNAYVEGLEMDASEALLDEIWQHVVKPQHTWTHQWEIGDLVMWDNRSVMHKRASFSNSERRLMRRTQVKAAA